MKWNNVNRIISKMVIVTTFMLGISNNSVFVDGCNVENYNTYTVYVEEIGDSKYYYKYESDTTVGITGYEGNEEILILPAEIDGKKVVSIDNFTGYFIGHSGYEDVKEIMIPSSVTTIGWEAFYGCTALKEITIPSSVATIDERAFSYCTGLEKIMIPSSIDTIEYGVFEGCSSLKEITIPSSVVSMCLNAFTGCSSLKEITIPSSVKTITRTAISGCPKLEAINVDEDNENYSSMDGILYNKDKTEIYRFPEGKIDYDFVLDDTVKYIDRGAFNNCVGIKRITIPKGVTDINMWIFDGWVNLEAINVDEDNEYYSSIDGVLYNKDKTKIYRFPEGKIDYNFVLDDTVEYIAGGAFDNCVGIKRITIPKGVTDIDKWMFDGCVHLEAINVEEGNRVYTSIDGVVFNKEGIELVRYPQGRDSVEYSIPEGVEIIKDNAFYECSTLKKVIIPKSVISIPEGTFKQCQDIVFYVEKGSYAEEYAKNNSIKFVIELGDVNGDVNGDGEIDIKDSALIKRYLAGIEVEIVLEEADVNGDGEISIKDSALIKRRLAGWE